MPNNRQQLSLPSYAFCVTEQVEFLLDAPASISTGWVREFYENNVSVDAAARYVIAAHNLADAGHGRVRAEDVQS